MKKFTLLFMGLLMLFLGGDVYAQTEPDELKIEGGKDWDAWQTEGEVGTSWNQGSPSENAYKSGVIRFKNNAPKYSRLGGKLWAKTFSGSQQTFTVTLTSNFNRNGNLINSSDLASKFCLIATKDGKYTNGVLTDDENNNWTSSGDFITSNGIETGENYLKIVASTGEQSTFDGNNQLVLTLNINADYDAVYLYSAEGNWKFIKIESITRTEGSAGPAVAVPTISPASGTYDGDLSVTITKGEGNDKVVYSVSGATTGNVTDAEFTESSKTLNLTGTGTITVTATGYGGEDASNAVTNTYTYSIPNGQSSTTSGLPHTFNSWDGGNSITFDNSFFSSIETGDYVVFNVQKVDKNGTVLGFRNDWSESPYSSCTSTSGGNGAKGTLNVGDTQWWMKVNSDVANALKNSTVRMQGGMVPNDGGDITSSVTLNTLKYFKCKVLVEGSDNSTAVSSKMNNVVVELTRSLVAGNWNTICLPFALTSAQAVQLFGSGYQLAAFTGVSGTTMQFTTTGTLAAGVPYLVKPTIDVSNASPIVLVDVSITAKTPQTVTYGDYSFTGTFTQKSFESGERSTTRFVGANNTLLTPNDGSAMKSLRCYFTVPSGSLARSFTVDDESAGIDALLMNNEKVNNGIFNLNGQRVAQPTKGLYIVNGKKVVIK